jgi:methionyl-tRNA synthetase
MTLWNWRSTSSSVAGTDEYGTTEAKALAKKCTPQELREKHHVIHSEIYK